MTLFYKNLALCLVIITLLHRGIFMIQKDFFELLIGGLLYFLTAKFGMFIISLEAYSLSLLWLPFGIGVILVERYGLKASLVIFSASFLSHLDLATDTNALALFHRAIPAFADSIAPILSLYFMKKYIQKEFKTIRALLPYTFFGGILPTAVSGTIIASNLAFMQSISLNEIPQFVAFLVYSDTLGFMLLYPLYKHYNVPKMSQIERGTLIITSLIAIALIVLSTLYPYLIFLLYPLLLIAAFRIRIKYLMMLLIFVVVLARVSLISFEVSFFQLYSDMESILMLSSFLSTLIFIIIGVSLHNSELERSKEKLQASIAQIKANEEALKQHAKLVSMGEMIGLIAHQWRQPLATSNMIISTLQTRNSLDTLSSDYLSKKLGDIEQSNLFMSQTIEVFLRYLAPKKELELFSPYEALSKTFTLVKNLQRKQDVKISISLSKDEKILGFEDQYTQVLLAIITNSIQAFKEQKERQIQITGFSIDASFYLEILDNAGGIMTENLEQIFEPYFTTKENTQGTGLGLYMAKIIIEKNMQGSLSVRNEKNGALFTIESKRKGCSNG